MVYYATSHIMSDETTNQTGLNMTPTGYENPAPTPDEISPDVMAIRLPAMDMEQDAARNKVFVGGLASTVTKERLLDYCERFGKVEEAIVMFDKFTERSRGFGFVTFESRDSLEKLMLDRDAEHSIDGKKVQFKRAVPASFSYNPEKIFVGGLPGTCDSEVLEGYFSKYGRVIDAQVMYDKTTGRSRGFGYVNFESATAVETVLLDFDDHAIHNKWIEVKRCLPNDSRRTKAPIAMNKNKNYDPNAYLQNQVYGYGSLYDPRLYGGCSGFPTTSYNPYMSVPSYCGPEMMDPSRLMGNFMMYGRNFFPYDYYFGQNMAPAVVSGGKGKGKGKDDGRIRLGSADLAVSNGENVANNSPFFQPTMHPAGVMSPRNMLESNEMAAANLPMTGEGVLDVAAIFEQLNPQ